MKLSEASLEWALTHLQRENDTDLFPEPIEIEIVNQQKEEIVRLLKDVDLGAYSWHPSRRFLIPKGELSYRMITQLDPLDSVMLSAVIYEFGGLIEAKRIPVTEGRVFSYRFAPEADGTLYSRTDSWKEFWLANLRKAETSGCIACLDISDFYNQIYHHTLESMMIAVGFPNEVNKSIMRLLEYVTQKMSRGIPIGPHASHLLAEMSLIPIDESLTLKDIDYCRYADDIIIFAKDETDARAKTYSIASILDSNQRLMLQRQKTRLYSHDAFMEYARQMIADNPMDIQEEEMLEIIRSYSSDNPYTRIPHHNLTSEEQRVFSKERVERLIEKYIEPTYPDYPRLRWLFRRFTQVGTPSAIEYCVHNMDKLIPAISDVCQYLISASDVYDGAWDKLGNEALALMQTELFKSNEFFQITVLNLFVKNTRMNHIAALAAMYPTASENIRRKIIMCAYRNHAVPFIRELKEQYPTMSEWTKRAYLVACSILIAEERRFFLKNANISLPTDAILEKNIINWALTQ